LAPRYGAEYRNEADRQQTPMRALQPGEGAVGPPGRPLGETAVEDERLDDEQANGEQHPHANHRVHPPEFGEAEPLPQVSPNGDVKAGRTDDGDRGPCLPNKPALDRLKRYEPIGAKFATANRREHHSGRHRHAADPDDHGKDMQRAGDNDMSMVASPRFQLGREGQAAGEPRTRSQKIGQSIAVKRAHKRFRRRKTRFRSKNQRGKMDFIWDAAGKMDLFSQAVGLLSDWYYTYFLNARLAAAAHFPVP
jgi:hypothetical protein